MIGEGSFGEVWLAQSHLKEYRAVKVVRRDRFADRPRDYERELAGIRRFEPISREHPGVVDILQVGNNEPAGYFYCVMELADDVDVVEELMRGRSGAAMRDAGRYQARTLRSDFASHGRLSPKEVLTLGLSLSASLQWLHSQALVHRDIKPENIIFVGGQPKLADVGLVAELGNAWSTVGTTGFVAPEGAGSAQADIYSLGKVMYEALTGKDRLAFPDLPGDLDTGTGGALFLGLNEVVLKACAHNPAARYSSVAALVADLQVLQAGGSLRQLRLRQKGRRLLLTAAALAALAAALAYGVPHLSIMGLGGALWLAVGGTCGLVFATYLIVGDRAEFLGRLRFELGLAKASLLEMLWPAKEIPTAKLLREWRAQGLERKAYTTSLRYLDRQGIAMPIWLFAGETAAIHLKDPRSAFHIINRFCRCREFTDEQKDDAIARLRIWARGQSHHLDLLQMDRITARQEAQQRVESLRQQGNYAKAERELIGILRQNPQDMHAYTVLVELYARDLRDCRRAEQVIEELASRPFADSAAMDTVEQLRRLLNLWLSSDEEKPSASARNLIRLGEPAATPQHEEDSVPEVLSPLTRRLVSEHRFGTAVEDLERQLKWQPDDLDLLLALMKVQMVYCNNLAVGERIFTRIEASPNISPAQKTETKASFIAWREIYQKHAPRRRF
jgi:hypothetical protein